LSSASSGAVGLSTFEGAQAVVADVEMDGLAVTSALTNPVDKSLVSTSADEASALFRLLDTTRAYVAAKLASSGEQDEIAGKHASYYSEKLKGKPSTRSRSGAATSPPTLRTSVR
jgi:predicted ATPase